MTDLLQKFSYKDSPYARPTQKWVCGKSNEGKPCNIGPNKHGKCRVDYECVPNKKGDRWICTRTTFYGDKDICTNGPDTDGRCCHKTISCQPVRSLKYKRSILVKWAVLLMIGFIVFFLAGHNKAWFFSPGELSFRHSQSTECSTCHKNFDAGVIGWIHQAVSGSTAIDNNQQCLSCHKLGVNSNKPHGVATNVLNALTNNRHEQSSATESMACMTCHIEHHGTDFDLLAVSSQNCALCHESQYKHLQKVHPEFYSYPYRRRTQLIFDHASHYAKHFYNKSGDHLLNTAPGSCGSCHVIDTSGIKMKVRGYKESCSDSGCHSDQFEDLESLVMFAVPELNLDDVEGSWPEDAESQITPMMAILLAGDPRFANSLSALEDDADLTELSSEHTSDLAWSIKGLLYDLRAKGQEAIKERLIRSFNCRVASDGLLIHEPICKLTQTQLSAFLALFPYQEICEGQMQWFPNLFTEVGLYRDLLGVKYQKIKTDFCEQPLPAKQVDLTSGEWILEDVGIEYLITNHSDSLVKHLLDLTAQAFSDNRIESLRLTSFEELSGEDGPGECSKCHSIDQLQMDDFKVNWEGVDWNPKRKDFVKFTHAEHLIHQDKKVCDSCHLLNEEADYLSGYTDNNPNSFTSGFTTTKDECGACHESAMVKNQCQTCHNYHVSGFMVGKGGFKYKRIVEQGHLKIWTDNVDYAIGDEITVSFTVDKSMYVRIVLIDTTGKLLTLFPNEEQKDNFCKAGETYQIPASGSKQKLTVTGPAGVENLLGVASINKFNSNALKFNKHGDFDDARMSKLTIRASTELIIH